MGELEKLELAVEMLGYAQGTPEYERALLGKKVERCQDLRGTPCSACPQAMFCNVLVEYKRMIARKKDGNQA